MLDVRPSKMGITHREATAAKNTVCVWMSGHPGFVLVGLDMAGLRHA